MKVKCIDTGTFKNITLDKEYEVLVENEKTYDIYADDGEQRTYRKKYFTTKKDLNTLLDELRFEHEGIRHPELEGVWYNLNGSWVSCGIDELDGLQEIEHLINRMKALYIEFPIGDISRGVFKRLFDFLSEEEDHASFILMSTSVNNLDEDNRAIYDELNAGNFEGYNVVMIEGENHNTNNNIRTWIIQL